MDLPVCVLAAIAEVTICVWTWRFGWLCRACEGHRNLPVPCYGRRAGVAVAANAAKYGGTGGAGGVRGGVQRCGNSLHRRGEPYRRQVRRVLDASRLRVS